MKPRPLPTSESELIQIQWEEFTEGYAAGIFTALISLGIMVLLLC